MRFQQIALENDLVVKVIESYAGLYLAQEQLRLIIYLHEKANRLFKIVSQLPSSAEADSLKSLIQVKLASYVGELLDAKSRLDEQKNLFVSIVGDSQSEFENVQLDDLAQIEKHIAIPSTLKEAMALLDITSPEFLAATSEIDVAQQAKNIEKADFTGNLKFFLVNSKTMANSDLASPTFADGFQASLQYNLEIGLPTSSRVKAQAYSVAAKIADREALMRQLILVIKNAYVKVTQLTNVNQVQYETFNVNSANLQVALVKLESQKCELEIKKCSINRLQNIFELIDNLEPNTMKYLSTSAEILLAKAVIAAKLGSLSH